MAISPIRPLNDSKEELERFRKNCENLGLVEKYSDILGIDVVELKKEEFSVIEDDTKKKRGRPKKIET